VKKWTWCLILTAGCLLLASCSPKSRNADCETDADCPADEACIGGACAPVECKADADCQDTEECLDHRCVSKPECVVDGDCDIGEICHEGKCVAGCRTDRDCPAGSTCLPQEGDHGVCAECQEDGDCETGYKCIDFVCVQRCDSDADCNAGHCDTTTNMCVECVEDDHCEPGFVCETNACVEGCREDADCQEGVCDLQTHTCVECALKDDCDMGELCVDGQCLSGCEGDRDCPAGTLCATQLGDHGSCVECIGDGDCADVDLPRCDNYVCVPECITDSDCTGQDEVCVDHHCQTIAPECDLRVVPAHPIEFGTVRIGSAVNFRVRLANEGGAACTVSAIEVKHSLVLASDFLMINAPLTPLVLPPRGQAGSAVEVELSFAPAEEGQHQATFWITSSDPDLLIGDEELACNLPAPVVGQACLPLTGKGVVLDLEAIPGQVDFGQVEVGCNSAQQVVSVYNLGEEVTVTDISLADPLDPHFEISNVPALPLVLSVNASFALVVRYQPQTPGAHFNRVVIGFMNADLPDLEIPLQGQGTNSSAATDVFHLPADVKVDVLWVVDNSGSMYEEQEALAGNFGGFIGWAQTLGVDYHIGVTSTDMEDPDHTGKLQGTIRVIDPATPNPNEVFGDNVRLGTDGSPYEMGLAASHAALSPPLLTGYNAGFLRDDAKLTVIYVSDEEDQSPGEVEFYVQYFLNLKGTAEWVTLSAICGDLPDGCSDATMGTAEAAPRYHAVLNRTGGSFHSICQTDWSGLMADLGEDAFAPIRTFPLSRPADAATIAVTVDGNTVPPAGIPNGPNGWTYLQQQNAVWFGDNVLPPNGSVVRIAYTARCL
jgi:hypothetical protein